MERLAYRCGRWSAERYNSGLGLLPRLRSSREDRAGESGRQAPCAARGQEALQCGDHLPVHVAPLPAQGRRPFPRLPSDEDMDVLEQLVASVDGGCPRGSTSDSPMEARSTPTTKPSRSSCSASSGVKSVASPCHASVSRPYGVDALTGGSRAVHPHRAQGGAGLVRLGQAEGCAWQQASCAGSFEPELAEAQTPDWLICRRVRLRRRRDAGPLAVGAARGAAAAFPYAAQRRHVKATGRGPGAGVWPVPGIHASRTRTPRAHGPDAVLVPRSSLNRRSHRRGHHLLGQYVRRAQFSFEEVRQQPGQVMREALQDCDLGRLERRPGPGGATAGTSALREACRRLRGVEERLPYVRSFDVGIVLFYPLHAPAGCDEPDQMRDREAEAPDARSPTHLSGLNGDAVELGFVHRDRRLPAEWRAAPPLRPQRSGRARLTSAAVHPAMQ